MRFEFPIRHMTYDYPLFYMTTCTTALPAGESWAHIARGCLDYDGYATQSRLKF